MMRSSRGIIVTSGNNSLPNLEAKYQAQGFGYAGADLYQGGYLTGEAMVAAGLKAGDKALVYDIWHEELRSRSPQGIKDALEKAGVVVDALDVSQEVNSDVSLATPILTAYLEAHPDLKAIGTQHGNITAALVKVLKANGYKPGDIIIGGIDLSPATVAGVQEGYISATFDQVLYLQGYMPVLQIWLTKNLKIPGTPHRHRCGRGDPRQHRRHRAPDRAGRALIAPPCWSLDMSTPPLTLAGASLIPAIAVNLAASPGHPLPKRRLGRRRRGSSPNNRPHATYATAPSAPPATRVPSAPIC